MTTFTHTVPRRATVERLRLRPLTARLLLLLVRVVLLSLVVLSAALVAQSLAASGAGHGEWPTPGSVTTPHPVPAGY